MHINQSTISSTVYLHDSYMGEYIIMYCCTALYRNSIFSSTTSLFKMTAEADADDASEYREEEEEGEGQFTQRGGMQNTEGSLEYNKSRVHRSTKLKRRELTLVEVKTSQPLHTHHTRREPPSRLPSLPSCLFVVSHVNVSLLHHLCDIASHNII